MTPTGRLFVASEICQEIMMLRTMPRTMQRMRMIMLSAIAALVMTAPTWAAECTIERDKLDDALRATPSCAAAYRLFELCEYGASGDVPLGAIVQEKCEADFLPRLDGAERLLSEEVGGLQSQIRQRGWHDVPLVRGVLPGGRCAGFFQEIFQIAPALGAASRPSTLLVDGGAV
jgi:hypothetical protein